MARPEPGKKTGTDSNEGEQAMRGGSREAPGRLLGFPLEDHL